MRHGRLHSKAHPGETGRRQRRQRRLRHRVRIGFGGDFSVGRKTPRRAHLVEKPHQGGRVEHCGRAATKEHRARRARVRTHHAASKRHLRERGADVSLGCGTVNLTRGVRVEVAVPATDCTERHMNVDAKVAFGRLLRHVRAHFFLSDFSAGSDVFSAAMKASCGTSTEPMFFMRFLPSFCFSRSLRLREMSPP